MTDISIRANLAAATADPARQVAYGRGGAIMNALPVVLAVYALFLWGLVFVADDGGLRSLIWIALLALTGLVAVGAWRGRASAPPDLLLTPQGLALRFNGVIAVPWTQIRGIETRSFEGFLPRYRGRNRIRFDNVTMIRVPPGFLQREHDAGRFGTLDPTTGWVIHPAEGGDWIALHHDIFGLTPDEVRAPVELRWQAYGDGSAPGNPNPLPPLRLGGFRPTRPVGFMLGTAVMATAIVIVLANLAGIWETQAQFRARTGFNPWLHSQPQPDAVQALRERDRQLRAQHEADRRALGIPEPVDPFRPVLPPEAPSPRP